MMADSGLRTARGARTEVTTSTILLADRLLFGGCDELYGKIAYGSQRNSVNLAQPLFEPPLVYAPELIEHDL